MSQDDPCIGGNVHWGRKLTFKARSAAVGYSGSLLKSKTSSNGQLGPKSDRAALRPIAAVQRPISECRKRTLPTRAVWPGCAQPCHRKPKGGGQL